MYRKRINPKKAIRKDREKGKITGNLTDLDIKKCQLCGLPEKYCSKCRKYHHIDNFKIEHINSKNLNK